MTPDAARKAVYDEFLSSWGATTPVTLEGELESEPGPGRPWARLSFRNLDGGQVTLGPSGGRVYRRVAAAFVQVFTPAARGMQAGATLAQQARAIFEGKRIGEVEFNDGTVTEIPLAGGEKSLQTNVEVRCSYDEIK